jgi:biotin operon repressor
MSRIPRPLQVAFNKIFVEKTMGEAFSPDTVEAVSELTEEYPEFKNKLFREMLDAFYAGRHPEKKPPVQMSLDECVKKENRTTEHKNKSKKGAEEKAYKLFDAFYNGKWFSGKEVREKFGWNQHLILATIKRLEKMGFSVEAKGSTHARKYRSI